MTDRLMSGKLTTDNRSALMRYGCALVTTGLAGAFRVATMAQTGARFAFTSFFISVIFASWYGGLGPGLLAILIGATWGRYLAVDPNIARPGPFLLTGLIVAIAMEAQQRAQRRLRAETAERMRIQDEEKRERQWSKITLSSIGDAVITTDAQGRVNFMNAVAESLTGWTLSEAMGQPVETVFRIVHEKTHEPAANPVERVLREDAVVAMANHTALVRKDGELIPIDDSGAPVRDEQRGAIGAVLVFRDVTERRKAVQEIQDARERLELALEAGRMGNWEWEIASGKVTWSANLERIQGLQPGSLGGSFEDFQQNIHPDDRVRVREAMERAVASREGYRMEYRILLPDGGAAWLEARGQLVLNGRGEPERVVGICMDVTQGKLAKDKVKIRLAQQNAVARLGTLALSIHDQGKLLQAAADLTASELGVEYASVLEALPDGTSLALRAGHGWQDRPAGSVVPGGNQSQAGYTLLSGGPVVVETFDRERRFQLSPALAGLGVASGISAVIPGAERSFGVLAAYAARQRAFTPEDIQFVQAMANIVANAIRRQNEEAARERLAAILESSEDAIVGKTLEGVVESWNRGAENIYGYTAGEMVGRSIMVLLPPDRVQEEHEILTAIRRDELVPPFETVRVRKGGVPIHVSLTISPIRDRQGRVIGASHIARDISERKQVEEKLQQTQKLESLGILAGGIAHDFNNLLTGILGNSSMILEVLPAPSPARHLAENVIQAAERAAHLTRQMLAYSGRGRFLIQQMNCSEQVRQITALIAASIPKNVQVRLALEKDLPPIEADIGQFQQLVMNLVINGAEAVGEGQGTVTIATGVEEVDAQAVAGMTFAHDMKPGRYVSMVVRDSGCGMDAGTVAKIFDPFFTTKFTGRGLGLAAVLGIVRGHMGAVRVSSAPGRGTSFQVLFPVCTPQEPEDTAPVPELEFRADTILVVDDEEMVLATAKNALERYGYRVVPAADGYRALEIFRGMADEIGLVLLDMTMPGMSGEQTFAELRRLRPDLPVVASSGYSEAEAMARFGAGVSGFLQKPYTAGQLVGRVAGALTGKTRREGAG